MKLTLQLLKIASLCCFVVAVTVLSSYSQSSQYKKLWDNDTIRQRIANGIEKNRKGDAVIRVSDEKGKPVKNYEYTIEQTTHDFLFGANIFMLKGFEKAEENKQFEDFFLTYFNYASVPFYWKTLEPQQGKLRFEATSEKIYRRPPPDVVVDFCQQHGLTMKGHTLVWEHPTHGMPDWTPRDEKAVDALILKRIDEIANRYGSTIKIWDVVNESLQHHEGYVLPKDYVFESFQKSQQALPMAKLLINEVTSQSWENLRHMNSPYYLQIQNLLCRGAKIDGIGLQFHFFSENLHNKVLAGEAMKPATLLHALDLLEDFRLPLHVTEITIPTIPADQTGEAYQATLTENFYKLWFSHPSVEAITWWNMVDDTAVPGEDKWKGGFLRRDFSVKPSGAVLDKLINKEWKTFLKSNASTAEVSFRGFYGKYTVKIKKGTKTITEQIYLRKGASNTFDIILK